MLQATPGENTDSGRVHQHYLDDEEGAEAAEYLALTGAIILLLVAVGMYFRQAGTGGVGEPFLNLLQTIIEVGTNWINKLF